MSLMSAVDRERSRSAWRSWQAVSWGSIWTRRRQNFLDSSLVGGAHLLLAAPHRQHFAHDRDLAGHREVVAHRQSLERRDDPGDDGHARRWPFFGDAHKGSQ